MLARAVLDPGVLVAALLSREGVPAKLVTAWLEGSFEIVTSPALLAELAHVLERPEFRPYVSTEEARRYVRLLARGGLLFDDPPTAAWVPADPGDDYLVCLAKATRASALVSGDAHLLALSDLEPPVVTPRKFLERVGR